MVSPLCEFCHVLEDDRPPKRQIAGSAGVWFLSRVDSVVPYQSTGIRTRIITDFTLVWFPSNVDSYVLSHSTVISRRIITGHTFVRFLSGMDSAMYF